MNPSSTTAPRTPLPATYTPPTSSPVARTEAQARSRFVSHLRTLSDRLSTGEPTRVLLLGDSITDGWTSPRRGLGPFLERLAPHGAVPLGVGGDHAVHLLWRVRQYPLEAIGADAAVVLIGANCLVRYRPEQVAEGVAAVLDEIARRTPDTRVTVVSVLPQRLRDVPDAPDRIRRINECLRRLCHDRAGAHLEAAWLDVFDLFADADGFPRPGLTDDGVHLTSAGYAILSERLAPLLIPADAGERGPVAGGIGHALNVTATNTYARFRDAIRRYWRPPHEGRGT